MSNHEHWKKNGKITVFIDAANVIYSLRDLGWQIDYKKLKKYFETYTKLVNIYFYTAYFQDDTGRKNLLEMLSRKGFIIRSKEVKVIKTKDGVLHKANCDVELTMDVMSQMNEFDTAVLMTGDSDFVPLVNLIKSHNKQAVVISTRGHVAHELIEAAHNFHHFDEFKRFWKMVIKSKNPVRKRDS